MIEDAAPQPRRVLVIEDDPVTLELLELLVQLEGYAVTGVGSAIGAAAITREERPCAILLDLALPFRSGLSLLDELRDDPSTASIPVVIVSALADLLPPDRCARADAVLCKPVDVGLLLATIERLVATPRTTEGGGAQAIRSLPALSAATRVRIGTGKHRRMAPAGASPATARPAGRPSSQLRGTQPIAVLLYPERPLA